MKNKTIQDKKKAIEGNSHSDGEEQIQDSKTAIGQDGRNGEKVSGKEMAKKMDLTKHTLPFQYPKSKLLLEKK